MGALTRVSGSFHKSFVLDRRVEVISDYLLPLLPESGRILDVGAGDGKLAAALMRRRPALSITGIDTQLRDSTAVPIRKVDGQNIPFENGEFDVAMAIDVLHHSTDAEALIIEMRRVSKLIVLKDHITSGFLDTQQLRLMDWAGNAHHGVELPYNYFTLHQWENLWKRVGLTKVAIDTHLEMYPLPLGWIGNRQLHFVAALSFADPRG